MEFACRLHALEEAGPGWAGPGRAEQGRAGPGRAKQDRAGQGRAGLPCCAVRLIGPGWAALLDCAAD